MKVAITADWLNSFGGAERVLLELHDMFPEAPIFTTVHYPRALPPSMQNWDVRTSFLQKIPLARRRHQTFLPLMPLAFEQFDLGDYDVVLTTSSSCAKGVITRPGTLNLCYCYTPSRYLWDLYHEYTRSHKARALIAPIIHWLRMWDRLSADRVDYFVAISHEVAGRIKRHYGRESEVIYPQVDVDRSVPNRRPPEDFYLVVSRLVAYKRIDLAVKAATRLGRRLIVVGTGPEFKKLKAIAGPTVEFLHSRSDAEIADLYARCRAFLFPGFEDFGITPVEAQAAGRPVVAYGKGGATETVIDGVTGVLFSEQNVASLTAALLQLDKLSLDSVTIRRNAERFDRSEFRRRLARMIDKQVHSESGSSVVPRMHTEFMESA